MSSFIQEIAGCKDISVIEIFKDRVVLQTHVSVEIDGGETVSEILQAELPINGDQTVFIRSNIFMLSGRPVPEAWDKSNFEKSIKRRVQLWRKRQDQKAMLDLDVKSIDWDEIDRAIIQQIEVLKNLADEAGQPQIEVLSEYQRRFTKHLCQNMTNTQGIRPIPC